MRSGGDAIHQRMLGRQDEVGCAVESIGPGREDGNAEIVFLVIVGRLTGGGVGQLTGEILNLQF